MEERSEEVVEAVEETAAAEEQLESRAFDEDRLAGILESVLFAAGEPLALKRLVEILDGPTPAEVRGALRVVGERLESDGRGVRLVEVAGGYQLRTPRENAEWVRAVFRDKPRKLGRAALETLAVIAYRQPVTRAEVEAIRGVDIDAVLTTLLQRDLVRVTGRRETVGRPILYGTTETFLELFGFRDLAELPTLKELPQGGEGTPDGEATAAAETTEGELAAGAEAAAAGGGEATEPGAQQRTADGAGEEAAGAAAGRQAGAAAPAAVGEAAEAAGERAAAEDSLAGGDHLEAAGGGDDPRGQGEAERPRGDGAGDPGDSGERQD